MKEQKPVRQLGLWPEYATHYRVAPGGRLAPRPRRQVSVRREASAAFRHTESGE